MSTTPPEGALPTDAGHSVPNGESATAWPIDSASTITAAPGTPLTESATPSDAPVVEWAAPAGAPPVEPGTDPLARSTWGDGEVGKTNVLAIIAMITAIVGILIVWFIGPIAAAVLGHVSLSQIKRRGEKGRPIALWATILGYAGFVVQVGVLIAFFSLIAVFIQQLQVS